VPVSGSTVWFSMRSQRTGFVACFSGVEAVAPGLASLINLKHLRITLKSGEDDRLKAFLPRLATLNGIAVSDEDNVSVAPSVREVSLTEGDLEAVAVLFGGIKSVRGPTTPADDLKLTQTFDAHVRSVMAKLKDRLEGMTDPFLRQSEIVMVNCHISPSRFACFVCQCRLLRVSGEDAAV
jgi:hypothetical protein